MAQFIFLIYLNRSGSTYLAGLLDRYDDIGVTPEARIPDGIVESSCNISDYGALNNFLSRLYNNHKFKSWEIDREKLKNKILNHGDFPFKFKDVFSIILDEYFRDSKASVYIYKSPYLFYISRIRERFPEARFLFIIRDPRAIYSSQKKTFDTDNRVPMASDPIKSLIQFKLAYQIFRKYEHQEWFYSLRYEDLILNPDKEVQKVLSFFDVKSALSDDCNDVYSMKLSEKQKLIHQNVQSGPITDRINAWLQELDKSEISVIQNYAGREIEALGYELMDLGEITFKDRIQIFLLHLKFLTSIRGKFNLLKAGGQTLISD